MLRRRDTARFTLQTEYLVDPGSTMPDDELPASFPPSLMLHGTRRTVVSCAVSWVRKGLNTVDLIAYCGAP